MLHQAKDQRHIKTLEKAMTSSSGILPVNFVESSLKPVKISRRMILRSLCVLCSRYGVSILCIVVVKTVHIANGLQYLQDKCTENSAYVRSNIVNADISTIYKARPQIYLRARLARVRAMLCLNRDDYEDGGP